MFFHLREAVVVAIQSKS